MKIFLSAFTFVLYTKIFASDDTASVVADGKGTLDWWQTSTIYQIYPRSFKDSDADGIGDLKGIESKADHFVDTGITAVWISPIYNSPMVDFGYDISNFTEIYPRFGTMDEFNSLIKTFHNKGIRVLLDFVPNHSSDQHEWFKKSKKKIDPYTDYYVWHDGVNGHPPNNWMSIFEGPAWEFVPERGQYYYHQFAVVQPDLNYRNRQLREEMKDVLRFWLDKGIDGFRTDAVNFLIEDTKLMDEPLITNYSVIPGYPAYGSLDHIYTKDLQGTYDMLAEFRTVLDEYKVKDGRTRLMLVEAYTTFEKTMKYYGNRTHPIAHEPFNFDFITALNLSSNAHDFDNVIKRWLSVLPEGRWPNWVIGNHDNFRVTNRYGCEMANSLNIVTLLLPGTGITYNGDEIGMMNNLIRWDETVDTAGLSVGPKYYTHYSRDPERTPFQWDSSVSAGFSNATETWLPVNPNYWSLNLKQQNQKGKSFYNVYKSVIQLRATDYFREGQTRTYVLSDWIFSFTRTLKNDSFVVIVNIGSNTTNVVLKPTISQLKSEMKVYVSSINSEHETGDILKTENSFRMRPKSSIVLGPKSKASFSRNSMINLLLTVSVVIISLCRW